MKILQLSGAAPAPAGDGRAATLATLRACCVSPKVTIHYAFLDSRFEDVEFVQNFRESCSGRVHFHPLAPGGALLRFFSQLRLAAENLFLRLKFAVLGVAFDIMPRRGPRITDRLIVTERPFPLQWRPELKAVLRSGSFDIVQVDYPWMLNCVGVLPKSIPNVFVVHELQAKILQLACPQSTKLARRMADVEARLLNDYDAVIALCEEDASLLRDEYGVRRVYCSPLAVETLDQDIQHVPLANPPTFSFLGGYAHAPNADGLRWLRDEIGAEIFGRLPNANFRIVGRIPDSIAESFGPGYSFTGFAKCLRTALSGTVFLCPIRIGSGMRIKILDAIAAGAPIVSTQLGARGLGLVDGESYFAAESASEFAERAVELIANPANAEELAANAARHATRLYSSDAVGKRRNEVLAEIIDRFRDGSEA